MAVYLNSAASYAKLSDIKKLQFLIRTSARLNPENSSTSEGASPRERAHPPLKALSDLVKRIGASGRENHTENPSGSGAAAKPTTLGRKAAPVTRARAPVMDLRDEELGPRTPERKRPRRSSAELVVDGGAVADINDVQSRADGRRGSWDACAFPPETQRGVWSSERMESVGDSDPEELPSHQETGIPAAHGPSAHNRSDTGRHRGTH